VHPRYVDREIARWLRDAGCQHVQMGVQSADEEYKRKQLLRLEKDAHLEGALAALAGAGLPTKLDHILGLPGEPPSAQEKARELYARFPPRRIQTFWLVHLPAIELTKNAVADGHVTPEEYKRIERGETTLFRTPKDGEQARFYQRYELLFRLIPLLPAWLRERLRAEHLPPLPTPVASAASLLLDVLSAALKRDAETASYARGFFKQIVRTFIPRARRPRRAPPPAPPAVAAPPRGLATIRRAPARPS